MRRLTAILLCAELGLTCLGPLCTGHTDRKLISIFSSDSGEDGEHEDILTQKLKVQLSDWPQEVRQVVSGGPEWFPSWTNVPQSFSGWNQHCEVPTQVHWGVTVFLETQADTNSIYFIFSYLLFFKPATLLQHHRFYSLGQFLWFWLISV